MKEMKIGIVTVEYNEEGNVIGSTFKPQEHMEFDAHLLQQLRDIPATKNSEDLKYNAEMVLSGWFSRIGEIELADRNDWSMVGKVLECIQFPGGMVKKCSMEFTFKQTDNEKDNS